MYIIPSTDSSLRLICPLPIVYIRCAIKIETQIRSVLRENDLVAQFIIRIKEIVFFNIKQFVLGCFEISFNLSIA